jgi:hypothetical protein
LSHRQGWQVYEVSLKIQHLGGHIRYDVYGEGIRTSSVQGDRVSVERTSIRAINKRVDDDVARDETVITFETSPDVPPAWVNFLRQRLHVLHVDYRHVGAGRIVVVASSRVVESVVQLVLSAVECADQYLRSALRNMRALKAQNQILFAGP